MGRSLILSPQHQSVDIHSTLPVMHKSNISTQEWDKECDGLENDFDADNEDSSAFRITNLLTPPLTKRYSARKLHCELIARAYR